MRYYDSIARGYDELYGEEQLQKAKRMLPYLPEGKRYLLLDVGCGSGAYLSLFGGAKVGVDPSAGLLERAKGGFFIQAEAEHLPFKNRCFDIVTSLTAVHNFRNAQLGLEEMHRVAKKRVILSVLRKSGKYKAVCKSIRHIFKVLAIVEEEKDTIFVLE